MARDKTQQGLKIENSLDNYEQVLPFINKVFKKNFIKLQAKVYLHDEYLKCHYVVKDNQNIVGNVLSYPLDYHCNGRVLKACGIGNVSVDKSARGNNLMSKMMVAAVDAARADGVDYMFLGGNRKRYERFGFVPCNTAIVFNVIKENVDHTPKYTKVEFKKISDYSLYIKQIEELYNRQDSRYDRKYFYEVINTWNDKKFYAIIHNCKVIGHIAAKLATISELNIISDEVTAQDIVISYFKSVNRLPFMKVVAYPNRRDIIDSLTGLCQYHSSDTCAMMSILNYKHCLEVLLNMYKPICGWDMVLEVEGNCKVELIARGGVVTVTDTSKAPDVVLPKDKATIILTNAQLAGMHGLPFCLPLYVTNPDEV